MTSPESGEQRRFTRVDQLPAALRSRAGWSRWFDAKRTRDPHLHQIEPTNHCPYTCIMCPRPEKMERELGFMEMDLYRKVIDEVATFEEPSRSKEIELFHFGESLLHPEIDAMVRYASERDLRPTLSVNASQLTEALVEPVLRARPYKVIISLDGFDEESYREIRGKAADFERAMEGIDRLSSVHRQLGSDAIIVMRMIQLEANAGQGERFEEHWRERGFEVELRTFFPWTESDLGELGEFDKYPPYMPCPFPWEYLVVQWDGSIVPCCRDYNAENPLGNVMTHTLREIWNGAEYEAFREQHRTGDYGDNRFCTDCMKLYYTDGDALEV